MTRWMVRGAFAAILLAALAVRAGAIADRKAFDTGFDLSARTEALIREAGLQIVPNPVAPPRVLSVIVYFTRAGCDDTSVAMPFSIMEDAETRFARLDRPEHKRAIRYMDHHWSSQPRISAFLAYFGNVIRGAAGLSERVPSRTALLVADPPGCAGPDTLGWARLWHRDFSTSPPAAGAS